MKDLQHEACEMQEVCIEEWNEREEEIHRLRAALREIVEAGERCQEALQALAGQAEGCEYCNGMRLGLQEKFILEKALLRAQAALKGEE